MLVLSIGRQLRLLALIAVGVTGGGMYCGPASAQAAPYATYFRYDIGQRLVGVITADPDGTGPIHYAAVRNTYNAQGMLVKVEKGELAAWQAATVAPSAWTGFTVFQTLSMSYDSDGRPVKASAASGGTTYSLSQTSYDNQGRVDCVVTRMNPATFGSTQPAACTLGTAGTYGPDRITKTTYAGTTHVLKVQRSLGTSLQQDYVTYTYTNKLQMSAKDANGNLTSYAYDGFGRLTDQFFPSKTTTGQSSTTDFEHYTYDNNGNRQTFRKRDASVIGYDYDAIDRLTFKDIPGSTANDVYYEYDLRSLQTSAMFGLPTGPGASTTGITTAYDGFGRVKSSTNNSDGYSRTLAYTYDADGDRLSIVQPDSKKFTYGYDGLDRVRYICETTVPCTATSPIVTIAYDNQGRRATLTRGANVASTGYVYDPVSRLQTLSHNLDGAGTANDVSFGFTYIPSSQIWTRNISIGAFANNNLPASSAVYVPNGLNQYTSITTNTTPVSPTWDPNGNLKFDGSVNYFYDVENRLIRTSGGKTANLDYDPDGRLHQTDTGTAASETHFLYDGNALIAEYNNLGVLQRRYVHGPGVDEPLVWYEGSTVGASNRSYYFQNHQGSIAAIANNTGANTQINTYDAYGVPGGTNAGRFQYTGQIRIPEIGMYYYKARIYNPTLGRFLQTDPIGYGNDLNLYAYIDNDPVNATDPLGLWTCDMENEETRCLRIATAIGRAKSAESRMQNLTQRRQLQAALKLWGKFGDPGVNVTFKSYGEREISTASTGLAADEASVDVTINTTRFDALTSNQRASVIAHEGSHGVDILARAAAGDFSTQYLEDYWTTEMRAYRLSSYVDEALGTPSAVWQPGVSAVEREKDIYSAAWQSVNRSCDINPEGGAAWCPSRPAQ